MENRLNIVGSFDTLVTLRSCTIGRGAQGQKKVVHGKSLQVFANISSSVSEQVDYGNLEANHTLMVTLYKVEGLTTRWQVTIHGKTYQVTNIDPISRFSPVCELTVEAIDGD